MTKNLCGLRKFSLFINSTAADNVVRVNGLALTPDGKILYMATDDGTYHNLWKSGTPNTGTSWSRVLSVAAATAGNLSFVFVNPDYGSTPVVYLVDRNVAAAANIYVSTNAGATFATRLQPAANVRAFGVQDANTAYLAVGQNVYKSTNGGWTWNTPVLGKQSGNITSIVIPRFDDVLIGGTSGASYSVDGGANFTAINTGLSGAGAIWIAYDAKYSGNKTIYAGGGTTVLIYRYIIGTSSQWEDMAVVGVVGGPGFDPIIGMGQANGVLYGATNIAANLTPVHRALNPTAAVGSIVWDNMNVGALPTTPLVALAVNGTSTHNVVYVAHNTTGLWGYRDLMAVAKPEITAPADKSTFGVDPVSGRGDFISIIMKKLGTTSSIMNAIDIEIQQKSTGLTGTPTWAAVAVPTEAPAVLVTGPTAATPFLSNMEYIWAIRVQNTISGDAVTSNWTTPRTFTEQSGSAVVQEQIGPVATSPQGGAQNIDPKLIAFTWAPVYGATEYTVIVATDAALTKTVAGTPAKLTVTSFQATNLEFETTYFYSVQATKPTVSPTAIGSFTTKAKSVPPPAPTTPAPPVTPQIIFLKQETPAYVWAIIVTGAVLIIAVIVLIVRTRRVP